MDGVSLVRKGMLCVEATIGHSHSSASPEPLPLSLEHLMLCHYFFPLKHYSPVLSERCDKLTLAVQ